MSAPQFTPGPWHFTVNNATYPNMVDVWAGANYIDRELLLFTAATCDASQANARLIAAAPSLYADAEFLCARISELEGEMTDDGELARQYFGHVVPALARMESALAEVRGDQ